MKLIVLVGCLHALVKREHVYDLRGHLQVAHNQCGLLAMI